MDDVVKSGLLRSPSMLTEVEVEANAMSSSWNSKIKSVRYWFQLSEVRNH